MLLRRGRARSGALAAVACAALLLTACAPATSGAPADVAGAPAPTSSASPSAPATPQADPFPAYAATVVGPSVEVFPAPGQPATSSLANPLPSGAPLTFLLVQDLGEWLQVLLPVRPNGTTGWVRAQDVVLAGVPYRLDVRTGAHELDLYDRDRLVRTFPVGIGKQDTPTPGGTFYLKELLQPPDPGGLYGPYAFGLSGFSAALDSFAGGEAVIGLHGTDDPSSIGRDVSSGCIRLHNADITELATLLPLGTPVRILA